MYPIGGAEKFVFLFFPILFIFISVFGKKKNIHLNLTASEILTSTRIWVYTKRLSPCTHLRCVHKLLIWKISKMLWSHFQFITQTITGKKRTLLHKVKHITFILNLHRSHHFYFIFVSKIFFSLLCSIMQKFSPWAKFDI